MTKSIITSILFFIGFSYVAEAQVQFNLSLLPDEETYLVSVVSDRDYPGIQNITGSGQVVVRVPVGEDFQAGTITSLVPDVNWTDNVYLDGPAQDADYTYIAFVLETPFTKLINYWENQETPLFTFKNSLGDCPSELTLVSNDDPKVLALKEAGLNVTQNLTIYGSRGNAYRGILNGTVTCGIVNSTNQEERLLTYIKYYPQPARSTVVVEWTLEDPSIGRADFLLYDSSGKQVLRVTKDALVANNRTSLDVSSLPAGLYSLKIISGDKVSQGYKLIVVR